MTACSSSPICRSEVVEKLLHRLGVGVGQNEGETVVGAGLDASKDIGEREALVAQARGRLPRFHQMWQVRIRASS
jgi:hypothetical protein